MDGMRLSTAAVFAFLSAVTPASGSDRQIIIYDSVAAEVAALTEIPEGLWITAGDLKRATRLELKPEGVCSEKLCFPIPEARKKDFLITRSGTSWFNLTAFAQLVKQPVAHDVKHGVWYFGPRPDVQNSYLANLTAPDFRLPDLEGKMHSLSDFRGKKVLLITWGSW
jgi:hypothetical protein